MITTPIPLTDALKSRRIRRLLPTDASSAELARLAPEILEQAVFSARNIYADVLAEIDSSLQQVMSGDLDQASMRVAVRKAIKGAGYDPAAHGITPGSLLDLSSMQRLNLVIDMQTKMAAGYIQFTQANDPLELDLYPCWEFVRHAPRIKERSDWPERFVRAGGHLTNGRMIARKDDPVWAALSVFGLPYAPFDYGSGMGLDPVPREECEAFGLITSREIPTPQSRRFTEDVQATIPDSISPNLRSAIESAFGPISNGAVTLRAQNRMRISNDQSRVPAGSPEGGQFASGSGAVPKHIAQGSSYTVAKSEAVSALKKGFSVECADGSAAKFGEWLVDKYEHGAGRKEGSDTTRLKHIGQAVATVRYANKGVRVVPGDQYQYRHKFKGAGCVVFTDMTTGKVNGFIYEYGKRAERLLSRYK